MTELQDRLAKLAQDWTRAQPVVAAFIASVVPDFHEAEDVLQSVAAAVVRKADSYDPGRSFLGWAIGVARYEVLMHARRSARDRHVFDERVIEQLEAACERLAPEWDERRRALSRCIEAISSRSRQLLELCYVDGLSPGRIAAKLGLDAAAVRVRLSRVRAELRQCIERHATGRQP